MNRFVRPNRQQANAPGSSQINFATAKKPVLLDPGLYPLQLERAELVGRNGNTSVALTLTDIASGQIVATKPMWVAGPNARSGDLAERNQAIIADLLRLAGQPLDGDPTDGVLSTDSSIRDEWNRFWTLHVRIWEAAMKSRRREPGSKRRRSIDHRRPPQR